MDDIQFSEFLDESIPLWRNDPVMFFREVLNFEPDEWQAEAARDESKGKIGCVSDEKIVEAYKMLAATEGILCEPASAASVAGLIQAHSQGLVKQGTDIVCILTGNGLKDPDNAIKYSNADVKKTSSEIKDVLKAMGI